MSYGMHLQRVIDILGRLRFYRVILGDAAIAVGAMTLMDGERLAQAIRDQTGLSWKPPADWARRVIGLVDEASTVRMERQRRTA